MKASYRIALLIISLGLAACDQRPKPPGEAPAQATPASAASVSVPDASTIDDLIKHVVADGVPFQPEAAKVEGNALVSTGRPGFVMFGPYVSFAPGMYRVSVEGSIPELQNGSEVRFDAVSGGAKTVHGEYVVTAALPSSGTIAEFDITIPEGVTDLEVRARVTEGASVRIESYQIVKND